MKKFSSELDGFLGMVLSGTESIFAAFIILGVLLYIPLLILGILINHAKTFPDIAEFFGNILRFFGV